ncbi:MAG: periplasmic heavy metal sensor [Comamonas sp.]|nr:periplasmic heavy metal sensor [Comamonas sp.]
MKKILIASALFSLANLTPALAQHHGHGHAIAHGHQSPYSGMQTREIKALSEQQIEGFRAGKGMAMAMPAELNGYPGPLHVLELANQIGLTAQQETETKKLYAEMQEEAKTEGEKLIAAERYLDSLFAQKKATTESVSSAVTAAANAQGKLRATHLRYHLAMMDVLTPEQVATYNKLRGY